jgi:competence ComEA-like helix-hairpin-helix protein
MARISLRAYNRDIEAMIDQNQIDEAIAHCRHILGRYSKHIATYRLMGKALLEAQRFSDASDVFHRVLSSVPDDFIAHLGMSIIREDEGNLDGAIWHMERAFEVQPSNAAVQVELRRLFGLKDDFTPQKIQLTRGALARMSAKSNLYSQAIAELRSALTDDPQRPDLQVVLAAMYAQTGAHIEAIETCNALVSKLPYCIEANRLLTELLPETERANEAQVFNGRLKELDPYIAHLSPVATTVDLVPDSAVTIERFAYQEELVSPQEPAQPEWATSLGVTIDEDEDFHEETPDWLSPELEETPMLDEIEVVDEHFTSEIAVEEESMVEEEPELASSEPFETEEIPKWMDDADVQPTDDVGKEAGEETPEWLRTVMEEPSEGEPLTPEAAAAGIELLDDFQDETISTENAKDESATDIEGDAFLEVEPAAEEPEDEDVMPELHAAETLGAEAASLGGVIAGAAAVELAREAGVEGEEIQELKGSQPEQESIPEDQPLEAEVPTGDYLAEDQIPDLASDEGVLIPEEEEPEIPDWLQGLGEGIPEEIIPETESELSSLDEQADIDELISPEPSIVDESEQEEGEEEFPESIPEWLSTVSPGEVPDSALAEELETAIPGEEQEIVRAEIPVWLRKMEQEHLAEMHAVSESETLEALDFDSDLTDLTGDDVPSWLVSAMDGSVTDEALEYETTEDIDEIIAELADEEAMISQPAIEEEFIAEKAIGEEAVEEETVEEELVEEAFLEGDTQPLVVGEQIEAVEPETVIEPEKEVPPVSAEIEAAEIEETAELFAEVDEEIPGDAEVVLPTGEDEEAAMAWLESLAERQGVDEEELLTSPEERLEEPPEWIQETVLDEVVASEEEVAESIEGIASAAIAGYAIEEELQKEEDEGEPIIEEEIPADEVTEWVPETIAGVEEPSEPEVEEILGEPEKTLELEQEPEEVIQEIQPSEAVEHPVEGVPEWLSGLAPEEEVSLEEPETEWAPSIISEEVTAPVEVPEELVSVKVDLNAASLAQLEKIPGIGFILAQNIVSYRDSSGPFQSVDELENITDLPPEIVEDLKNYLSVELVGEISAPVSTLPELQDAWNSVASGDISSAVDQYSELIKKGEHLDEIIRDLQEALTIYPVDASLFQILGDAYLRANMLQEALDAYNRAEDLIK